MLDQDTIIEVLGRMEDLDESDHTVNSWEAEFLDSIISSGIHTDRQLDKALEVLEKYGC